MIVKDEERTIAACIDSVIDICEDVVVVDTGSTDGTVRLLRQRYGITPLVRLFDHPRLWALELVRNASCEATRARWILSLDADERLTAAGVALIAGLPAEPGTDGYFCAWNTYQDGTLIEDYKLSLFRKGLRWDGFVHENLQQSARETGSRIEWLDGLEIQHFPEPVKDGEKSVSNRERLEHAIALDPEWHRYRWFLGYKLWREGRSTEAIGHLQSVAESESRRFPVECLNSGMLLVAIHAQCGDCDAVRRHLSQARRFLDEVGDDFEVRVNFRLGPWLERAAALQSEGKMAEILAYRFPY